MSSDSSKYIRLAVSKDDNDNEGGRDFNATHNNVLCLVDISKGLGPVLQQVSSEVGYEVIRLTMLIFNKDGLVVGTSSVTDVQSLEELAVVFAVKCQRIETSNKAGREKITAKDSHRGQKMLEDEAVNSNGSYRVGTKVWKYFGENRGWLNGKIISIDDRAQTYLIRFSDGYDRIVGVDDQHIQLTPGQNNSKNKRKLREVPTNAYHQAQDTKVDAKKKRMVVKKGTLDDTQTTTTEEEDESTMMKFAKRSLEEKKCLDQFGCRHFGVTEMYICNVLTKGIVKQYMGRGDYLDGKRCDVCQRTPTDIVEKGKIDKDTRAIIFYCDCGNLALSLPPSSKQKEYFSCDFMRCAPCHQMKKLEYAFHISPAGRGSSKAKVMRRTRAQQER